MPARDSVEASGAGGEMSQEAKVSDRRLHLHCVQHLWGPGSLEIGTQYIV